MLNFFTTVPIPFSKVNFDNFSIEKHKDKTDKVSYAIVYKYEHGIGPLCIYIPPLIAKYGITDAVEVQRAVNKKKGIQEKEEDKNKKTGKEMYAEFSLMNLPDSKPKAIQELNDFIEFLTKFDNYVFDFIFKNKDIIYDKSFAKTIKEIETLKAAGFYSPFKTKEIKNKDEEVLDSYQVLKVKLPIFNSGKAGFDIYKGKNKLNICTQTCAEKGKESYVIDWSWKGDNKNLKMGASIVCDNIFIFPDKKKTSYAWKAKEIQLFPQSALTIAKPVTNYYHENYEDVDATDDNVIAAVSASSNNTELDVSMDNIDNIVKNIDLNISNEERIEEEGEGEEEIEGEGEEEGEEEVEEETTE